MTTYLRFQPPGSGIYRVSSAGNGAVYVEGMELATGIVFDRTATSTSATSGTIFKVSRQQITCSPPRSVDIGYHQLGPDKYLYVTGPTTSSFD
jgi:hypothetical protein